MEKNGALAGIRPSVAEPELMISLHIVAPSPGIRHK